MNHDLVFILNSISESSYRITKDDLCKSIAGIRVYGEPLKCEQIHCGNCPIFASINDIICYPNLMHKTNETLNES